MNRNQERVLSDVMISDIKDAIYTDLRDSDELWVLVDNIMNAYLANDWNEFGKTATENIEAYEDNIIAELNTELMEDSFDQAENGN
jgi:hypothetical protein